MNNDANNLSERQKVEARLHSWRAELAKTQADYQMTRNFMLVAKRDRLVHKIGLAERWLDDNAA